MLHHRGTRGIDQALEDPRTALVTPFKSPAATRTTLCADRSTAYVEDAALQFARQLYERCVELRGKDHEQAVLLFRYISALEDRDAP